MGLMGPCILSDINALLDTPHATPAGAVARTNALSVITRDGTRSTVGRLKRRLAGVERSWHSCDKSR